MARLNMSAPWVVYYREVEEMFRHDAEVHVVFDEENYSLKLYVDNVSKAEAIARLLPKAVEFGNVKLNIAIVPADMNGVNVDGDVFKEDAPLSTIFEIAFDGNDAFSFAKEVKGVFSNNLTYVVFAHRVVQYFNDDLGDVYGQCSTLYQNIASHIFCGHSGVFYCTDRTEDDKCWGTPMGEWP